MTNNNEITKYLSFKDYLLKNNISVNQINTGVINAFLKSNSHDIKISLHEMTKTQPKPQNSKQKTDNREVTVDFKYFISNSYRSRFVMRESLITKNANLQKAIMGTVSFYNNSEKINFKIYLN